MTFIFQQQTWLLTLVGITIPVLLGMPSLVAIARGLPDRRRIVALNFAGILIFNAWLAALLWSLVGRKNVSYYESIMRRKWHYLGVATCASVLVIGVSYFLFGERLLTLVHEMPTAAVRTAIADTGPIGSVISASGKLRAKKTVQVGAEVSGQIVSLETDLNEKVREGQVIARLNPATYQVRVAQAKAQLEKSLAGLEQSRATVTGAEARLSAQRADFERKQVLFAEHYVATSTLDQARAAVGNGEAEVRQDNALILGAKADVLAAQAALDAAQLDLDRTTIRAPINGTVLKKLVEPGQTVVAALQTPILFEIAEDLSSMRLEADVDEADIGKVSDGQTVKFTVDAYPGEDFNGSVEQIRKSANDKQGIVTYTVVIGVANPGERLFAGMTANIEILPSVNSNVLRVPLAALRFRPVGAVEAPKVMTGGPGRVWRVDQGKLEEIDVRVGAIGDQFVEISDGTLKAGDAIAIPGTYHADR